MHVTVRKLFICETMEMFCKSMSVLGERVYSSFGANASLLWIVIIVGMWVISCARKVVHESFFQVENWAVALSLPGSLRSPLICIAYMWKTWVNDDRIFIFAELFHVNMVVTISDWLLMQDNKRQENRKAGEEKFFAPIRCCDQDFWGRSPITDHRMQYLPIPIRSF